MTKIQKTQLKLLRTAMEQSWQAVEAAQDAVLAGLMIESTGITAAFTAHNAANDALDNFVRIHIKRL